MKYRLESLVVSCILASLMLSAFLRIAIAPGILDGQVMPEFPIPSEVIATTGLLATYAILRRRRKAG